MDVERANDSYSISQTSHCLQSGKLPDNAHQTLILMAVGSGQMYKEDPVLKEPITLTLYLLSLGELKLNVHRAKLTVCAC